MENLRVRRAGFAYRRRFEAFLQRWPTCFSSCPQCAAICLCNGAVTDLRYKPLCPETWPNWHGRLEDGVSTLVNHLGYKEEEYQLGRYGVLGGIGEYRHGSFASGSIKECMLLGHLKKWSEMSSACFLQDKNFHPLPENPLQNWGCTSSKKARYRSVTGVTKRASASQKVSVCISLCGFVHSSFDSADIVERLQRKIQVSADPTCRSAPAQLDVLLNLRKENLAHIQTFTYEYRRVCLQTVRPSVKINVFAVSITIIHMSLLKSFLNWLAILSSAYFVCFACVVIVIQSAWRGMKARRRARTRRQAADLIRRCLLWCSFTALVGAFYSCTLYNYSIYFLFSGSLKASSTVMRSTALRMTISLITYAAPSWRRYIKTCPRASWTKAGQRHRPPSLRYDAKHVIITGLKEPSQHGKLYRHQNTWGICRWETWSSSTARGSSLNGRNRFVEHELKLPRKYLCSVLSHTVSLLQMKQKVIASDIFKDQKDSYPQSVGRLFLDSRLGKRR